MNLDVLPVEQQGDALVPQFLSAADDHWLVRLVEEYERFAGARSKELEAHMRAGLPFDAPTRKLALARQALGRLWRVETVAEVRPPLARERVFMAAARRPMQRAEVLEGVASGLEVSAPALEQALLADIPGERRLQPPADAIDISDLRLRINLLLVQRLLERSTQVRIYLSGNARPVVRHAKLKGLICNVVGDPRSDSVRIEISGPLALFKRTLVYGRALGELPPQLARCDHFFLEADIALGARPSRLILATGAPIFPARQAKRYDSKVEERFARDFTKATVDWDLTREPEPIPIARGLIFPDFALRRRLPPFERWWLEIIGFWTPEYLEQKLASLRLAGLERLILCIDAERNCSERDLPPGARVVRYRRKVDVEEVLRLIETEAAGPAAGRVAGT